MTILRHINSLALLRPLGISPSIKHVCLITMRDQLDGVETFLANHPHLVPGHIVLLDYLDGPESVRVFRNGAELAIAVGGVDMLARLPHLEMVYISPPADNSFGVLTQLSHYLASVGPRTVHVHLPAPVPYAGRQFQPDFFDKFAPELETVYNLLADQYSREVYAARVKAVLTGDSGYVPVSEHPEYFHPLVRPETGDVMIDGGVSDMVGAQMAFAERVGPSGQIYGFEPIPSMYESAVRQLAQYPRYEVHCAGLGRQSGKVFFKDMRDSSRMVEDGGQEGIECRITAIDDFAEAKKLERLDCIKLDVEGAELAALRGAKKTIQRFKPKLIICLYHNVQDLISIPMFVKSLCGGYELYAAHSSCHFIDTILYARAR